MTGRLNGLDALRGIAALIVLAFHAQVFFGQQPVLHFGWLAVDFFFMLSGYVMARTYEPRFASGYTGVRFMLARLRRVWPVMAAGTVLGLALVDAGPAERTAILIAGLTFIPLFGRAEVFAMNPPAWSIHFELAANVVHALILRFLPLAALLGLTAALIAAYALMVYITGDAGPGMRPHDFLLGYLRVAVSYTMGVALWRLWQDNPPVSVHPALAMLAMPVLLTFGPGPLPSWLFQLLFVVVVCPLIIAGGLRSNPVVGAALGSLSFPLYAVHAPVLGIVNELGGTPLLGAFLAIVAAGIVAPLASAAGRKEDKTPNVRHSPSLDPRPTVSDPLTPS